MPPHRCLSQFAVSVVIVLCTATASAQEPATRTELKRADLSGAPGMEVISSIVEVQPGEELPRHFHHGIEAAYVLQGAWLQAPGKEPVLMPTGTTVLNLRDVVHGGTKVVGDKSFKLFAVHIVDKNKPLYAPAN